MGSSVRRSAQCPVDRLLFLLFVRVVLPASAQEASFGRSPRGRRSVVTKNSCRPHFHCAEWSCVVLSGSPRHHIGSGTNWPVKSPTRDSVCLKPGLVFSGGGGRLPERPVGSMGYALKWSFATRMIRALITRMKSAPCTP